MPQGSSARFGLDLAPAGLSLVQELINTALLDPHSRVPDLLASVESAQGWLDAALLIWAESTRRAAPTVTLTASDLPRLRALREAVRAILLQRAVPAVPSQRIELELTGGEVTYRPTGEGWRSVSGLVHVELLLAQHAGAWERIKTCENPVCGAAFYDRTRNGSRVWHDTKTCGNVMNLRASRARRARG
ncbi:CGNR zinc finger domain-containing protein [Solirubrobacter ginsenosidimutans]|uniref:CGNR zinc finger domain-containing protein n=1 Tax=Solirubrobacter ginsenosidimutans TaxID=490573 RepID=A0A9X3S1Z9_9ACTN|nr:CGNR zinc finger domain-containing protein [Solirubrobacter ginsenosidimutans]MDA0162989.1 CGNR zinc finger domain-containing protein [Solirubrobacter ginsenosidimutans]